jgi:hypothetical protein
MCILAVLISFLATEYGLRAQINSKQSASWWDLINTICNLCACFAFFGGGLGLFFCFFKIIRRYKCLQTILEGE